MKIECPECGKLFNQSEMINKQYVKINGWNEISKNVEIKYCKKCYKKVNKEFNDSIKVKIDELTKK